MADAKPQTNWILVVGTVVGTMSATVAMMISFVNLIAGPIKESLAELKAEHYAFLARYDEHVEDGHPHSVIALVQANREADIERDRQNFERARELAEVNSERTRQLADLNERELDRIRSRVQQLEDYAHISVKGKPP